jgi:hypothetical protein
MLFVLPSFCFPFFCMTFAMLFHLRASTLVASKSLKVDCNVVYVVGDFPPSFVSSFFASSSLGAPDGLLIGLGESSRFTMEEYVG